MPLPLKSGIIRSAPPGWSSHTRVRMVPGATALARIPSGPSWTARFWVSEWSPALALE